MWQEMWATLGDTLSMWQVLSHLAGSRRGGILFHLYRCVNGATVVLRPCPYHLAVGQSMLHDSWDTWDGGRGTTIAAAPVASRI